VVLTADQIIAIDARMRAGFKYVPDGEVDSWRSHYEAAKAGAWSGDCDDLTSTVLDALHRKGHPADRMWRLLVSSKRTAVVDHMVGVVEDVEGRRWVVGDTFGPAYPASRLKHRVLFESRVSDRTRNGLPFWRAAGKE
jgi:hypothetical protein